MRMLLVVAFCVLLVVCVASADDARYPQFGFDGNADSAHDRVKRQWGYGLGYGMGMYRPWGMYGMYRPWGMMPFMMGR
ncbi:unnamed protein product [Caenorhabditis auriculariae]|uniref:Uncharacterized protein n=1 Tax=Caenorhabditis auriculariae TaxID=2777116 RepID=A0A8S1GUB8_9PELO|nr:unnamed protein product [Caenorhabditis auriculariae]